MAGRAKAASGWTGPLATLSGVILLLLAAVLSVLVLANIVGRYGFGHPVLDGPFFGRIEYYFGLGFVCASLLALPAALAAPIFRHGQPPLRSHSALALAPGCPLALVAAISVFVFLGSKMPGGWADAADFALRNLIDGFARFAFLFFPLVLALAAVLGGARAPETTAIIAAPTVLAASYGYFGDFSLARLILAVAIPAAAALALLAPLYLFAPARAVTPWLAGPALAIGVAAPLAAGFLTPTETAGLYAVFALAGGLPIRRFGLRRKLGPLLRQAGMETVSIAIVVATAMLVAAAIGLLSAQPHWSDIGVPARTAVLLGGGGFFVLAVLLTPALALVALIVLSHAVESAGLDPVWIGTVATLLGLAAMALRAVRGKAGAAAASSLPPGPALAATAVFLVLAGGIAFWPDIVMAPIDALLG